MKLSLIIYWDTIFQHQHMALVFSILIDIASMDLKTSDFYLVCIEIACPFHLVCLYVIYQKFKSNLMKKKNYIPSCFLYHFLNFRRLSHKS